MFYCDLKQKRLKPCANSKHPNQHAQLHVTAVAAQTDRHVSFFEVEQDYIIDSTFKKEKFLVKMRKPAG